MASTAVTWPGRLRQLHSFFRNRSPDQMLATAGPVDQPLAAAGAPSHSIWSQGNALTCGDRIQLAGMGYSAPVDFLPAPSLLKAASKSLAVLDMIMEPDPEYRYYSYHLAWGPAEDLASMQNGSGDEYSLVFLADGAAYVRGFDHESPMSAWGNDGELWPGLIAGIPDRFLKYVHEQAFWCDGIPDMTVCLWTESDAAGSWEHGSIPPPGGPGDQSGAGRLFDLVSRPEPSQYRAFARHYYEVDIDAAAVADIYASRLLDQELVSRINPERVLSEMHDELRQVGYPVSE